MAKNCKACGIQLLASGRNRGGRGFCVPCANKHGLCTSCRARPQDRPGYKQCSICYSTAQKRCERTFARIGQRTNLATWQICEIEKSKALGAKLLAECLAAKEQNG